MQNHCYCFENRQGTLRNVSAARRAGVCTPFNARGLAVGDLDNDGDFDSSVCVNGGGPLLLRNEGAKRTSWLGLRLKATQSNSAAEGAEIRWKAGEKTYRRLRTSGGSYLSSHDSREILGLGGASSVERP